MHRIAYRKSCSDGGIGRHEGLKIPWPLGCAGSSPAPSTGLINMSPVNQKFTGDFRLPTVTSHPLFSWRRGGRYAIVCIFFLKMAPSECSGGNFFLITFAIT